jgi:aminoglycoside phosphotransferase
MTMMELFPQQAQEITRLIGVRGSATITPIKQYNHVYRIDCGGAAFFLKTYTKDWYGDNVAATGGCVDHEACAWSLLAAHGLAAPEVALARRDCENPLGRPFIVTRELRGANLTAELRRARAPGGLIESLGAYLRRMHDITFAFPGYLMTGGGPAAPPIGGAWQHPIWSAKEWQKNALATLRREGPRLSRSVADRLAPALAIAEQALAPAYAPPRFAHGDCWAHQFFVLQQNGDWQISGVVDMEAASAGDSESDLVHLFMELASVLPASSRWWEAFFAGYGRAPDFHLFRLRLLGSSEAEFHWIWPGMREQILAHALGATSWADLFTHAMWLCDG